MRKLFLTTATALILALTFASNVFATDPTSYQDIVLHGQVMRDQLNQVRSPDVVGKYFLYKVADARSYAQAKERDATGTSEFDHDLGPVIDALNDNDVCWNWVGENIGFSNTLRDSPPAATADDIMDAWEASPSHNSMMKNSSGDWTGGGWVKSNSGTYFFVMYVVDVCGI